MAKKKSKPHPTRRVTIKAADVDEGILPVVEWINSFPGAYTQWSCQGDDGPGAPDEVVPEIKYSHQRPYCVFLCGSDMDLARILMQVRYGDATVKAEWYGGSIRYNISFTDTEGLKRFVERLRGVNNG